VIGSLRGVLRAKHPPYLLLDVQGVGYEVEAPMSTFYKLPAVGEEVTLHTHLIVREDAHLLFGFADVAERALFRALIRVTGIGAKLAVTILSGMEPDVFVRCVQDQDALALTRLPGVGKRTAERLIVEMKDRLEAWSPAELPGTAVAGSGAAGPAAHDEVEDALSALVALGYRPAEAQRMVRATDTAGLSSEEIIRRALQSTVK
jgi:Holliday junction DNA helicase RuvA